MPRATRKPQPETLEAVAEATPDSDLYTVPRTDGGFDIYARVTPEQVAAFAAQGVPVKDDNREFQAASKAMEATVNYVEGMVVQPSVADDRWLSPKLTVPSSYYTRLQWSQEYYTQEPLVNSLVDRDIAQAIKRVEFQMDEEKPKAPEAKAVLDKWRTELNEGIQQHDGLHGYNRRTARRMILSSLVVSIANWGTMEVDGKFYQVPKVIQNLDPAFLVPYRDPIAGHTVYYYKITPQLADKLRASRRKDIAWRQMIPDLGRNIVDALPDDLLKSYRNKKGYDRKFFNGPFIQLPPELVYVIRFKEEDEDCDYPLPSLVPIFSALAMKRKLQLADWAVADGMINMLIVFSFPEGSDPTKGQSIVRNSMAGGRVQGLSIPAQVKVQILTPPSDLLNSKDKFWVPVSEILNHFGYPLNSASRGAGDLDSGPLDLATNAARINEIRDPIEALVNYWLRKIAEKNGWTEFTPTILIPRVDLANSDTLRSHVLAVYDRGSLSEETLLDSVGTTVEREVARRKREAAEGIEDVLEIRPSFSQTTGVPGDGRTPDSQGKPRGGAAENRPSTSAQSETRT